MKKLLFLFAFIILSCSNSSPSIYSEELIVFPDLSPEYILGSASYSTGQTKDVVVRIRNVSVGPTTDKIVFYVAKMAPNFNVGFDPCLSSVIVSGNTYSVENHNWDIYEESSRWRFESKSGVFIDGNMQALVSIKVIATGFVGSTAKLLSYVALGTGGGETPTTNNRKTSIIVIN